MSHVDVDGCPCVQDAKCSAILAISMSVFMVLFASEAS